MFEATDISVHFGGVVAVDHVSFAMGPDEIVGVVGPNGSGKSTLLNAISGLVEASGAVRIGGEPLSLGSPLRIRQAGLLRTFQTPQPFTGLSCIENAMLSCEDVAATGMTGALFGRARMWRHDRARMERAHEALERVGLAHLASRPAHGLAYGQSRYLEIARAIAGDPRILAMDEPSAGLNRVETSELAKLITSLRNDGRAVLVVDHKIDFLGGICDRLMVLQLGRVLADGRPDEVLQDQAVIDAYLGA